MATIRQQAAINKLVENRGVVSKTMAEVGYKPKSAKNPKNLTESKAFKEAKPDILNRLMIERERAMNSMKGKISKAKYRDLVDAVDKITKNIQLLSGGTTEKTLITFDIAFRDRDE